MLASRPHVGSILGQHKIKRVATLLDVAGFTSPEANRIRSRNEDAKVKDAAHLRPVKGKQPFHNKEVAGTNRIKAVACAGVGGKIENRSLDDLTAAQCQQMLGQK